MKRRFWAGLLSFVMLWSLLPASALAAEDESVKYGRYNNGVWEATNDTGEVTETGVEGVKSVSKTAEKKGDNTYEVTLKVEMEQTTTTEQPGAAATVLVMDVSGSMGDCTLPGHRHTNECYEWERKECTKEGNPSHYYEKGSWEGKHKWGTECEKDEDGNYYYLVKGELKCGQTEHTHSSNCPIKLASAKNAAIDFIKNYGGWTTVNGVLTAPAAALSRYVSIVPFSTDAAVKQDWVDVSTEQGYEQAKNAINALKADGGTNLYAGLRYAEEQLNSTAINSVPASAKNVVALSDGEPTYYEEYWNGGSGYSKGWYTYGEGSYCDQDTYDKTIERATELKESAPLYTVCFGVADQKMCKDIDWSGNEQYYDITLGEYLKTKIATSADTAYNADNAEQLMQAFKAITDTITTGLNAGTVTDSLPVGVSTTDGAFSDGSMTWVLNDNDEGVKKVPDEANGKTTYTWTKSYTVTIDPTKVAENTTYQPLNEPTTLKVTVDGQEKKVAFPIPAGKVAPLTTLTVSGKNYEGTYDGKDHGEAATASIDGAKIEYSTDNGTTWSSETVPTIKNVGETKVLVRATLKGYAAAEDAYTLKVNYAPVTVKADDKTVQLGSPAPKYTATVTGLVNDEPKSLIEYKISCDYTENASAGERLPITVTGEKNQGNYTVTYVNGWLDVDQILPNTADVEVRFYKDSVDEANRLNVTPFYMRGQVVDSEIKLGFPVIDMFRPEGYDGGVQQGKIPYIVKEEGPNVIEVLYTKTEIPTTGSVVITKQVEGVDAADIARIKELTFNVKNGDEIVENGSLRYDGTKLTTATINLKEGSYNLSEDLEKAESAIPGYKLVGVRFAETGEESESAVQTDTDDFTGRYGDYDLTITADKTAYVTCINTYEKKEVEPDTYTVTYTDGANGSAFDDQVYENLHLNAETPAFNGTPTRSGYTFNGWNPDVAKTVTGNAIYKATWTKNSSGRDDDSDTYYLAVLKIDAQDGHVLKDAKFGLYADDKQIATATSSSKGYARFSLDERVYNKLNKNDDLYVMELTAPDGYVKSSRKYDVSVNAFVKNNVLGAEEYAITVTNSRSSTPDRLNDEEHFAYVIGYKDGNVRPYGLISRAETTTIFFRLLKDSVRDGNLLTSNTYTDVADNYWANTAISTMTGLGIVQGRTATTFDPYAPITRAQFAAICARFDDGKTQGGQTFTDIQGHWAQAYIERAAELGWIKGFEDGSFRPDTYITRAQAMTMINRVLNRIPEDADDLLSNMNVWPDCNPGDWFYLAVQEATNSHDYKHKAGNYETWSSMNKDPDWTRYEN